MRVVKAFGRGPLDAGAFWCLRPHPSRLRARDGAASGPLLGAFDACPEHHDGRRGPGRRHRRRPRLAVARRPGRLHDSARPAAVPDHRPRLDPVDGPGGGDGSRPGLRGLRRRHGRRRPSGCRAAPQVEGRLAFEHVGFSYPGSSRAGAARHRPRHRARRDGGDRGPDRVGQEHAWPAFPRVFTTSARADHPRRPRRARHHDRVVAAPRGRRVRGPGPFLHERAREPGPRTAGRATDDEIAEALELAQAGLRTRSPLGPRHPHRRAGPGPVGRTATAARAGPGRPRPPVGARPRRSACPHSTSTRRRSSRRAWRGCFAT